MVQTIAVEKALELWLQGAVFIDTRTPSEFEEDHLPGAINLPVLSNEERVMVGTIYKQKSKEEALEKGKEFFRGKMPLFLNEVEKHRQKTIIVNCWRGGMRSRVVAELLQGLGYAALQLQGGYKEYRRYVREQLERLSLKSRLVVLWGLTCTGKTALLKHFSNALDLEGLAQHRSSLYGAIGLKPNSQKRFDNLLLWRLRELNNGKVILVEGESRKIGDVQVPAFLYKAMLKGVHVLVTRSMEKRAEHARKEYFKSARDIMQVKKVTETLFKVISNEKKQEAIQLLEEGLRATGTRQKETYRQALKILLEHYYDPLYAHTLQRMDFALEVDNDDEEKAFGDLKGFIGKGRKIQSKKVGSFSVPQHCIPLSL